MANEELIAKIAGHAGRLIKEAEESGIEVVRKVDPEVSEEIITFLLKTPETFKRIQHDAPLNAVERSNCMALIHDSEVQLAWLADGSTMTGAALAPYMEDPSRSDTLPDAWFNVLVDALGCYIADHLDGIIHYKAIYGDRDK